MGMYPSLPSITWAGSCRQRLEGNNGYDLSLYQQIVALGTPRRAINKLQSYKIK